MKRFELALELKSLLFNKVNCHSRIASQNLWKPSEDELTLFALPFDLILQRLVLFGTVQQEPSET